MTKSAAAVEISSGTPFPARVGPAFNGVDSGSEQAYRLARRLLAVMAGRQVCVLCPVGDVRLAHEFASQIAVALGVTGFGPVLLVDGDLARPMLHQWHDAHVSPGLADLLSGNMSADSPDLGGLARAIATPGVFLLPAGAQGRRLTVDHSRMVESVFAAMRAHFALVLVSAGSILGENGTGVLAAHADCAALLVEAGCDDRTTLVEAAEAFSSLQIPVLGAVYCDTGRR